MNLYELKWQKTKMNVSKVRKPALSVLGFSFGNGKSFSRIVAVPVSISMYVHLMRLMLQLTKVSSTPSIAFGYEPEGTNTCLSKATGVLPKWTSNFKGSND